MLGSGLTNGNQSEWCLYCRLVVLIVGGLQGLLSLYSKGDIHRLEYQRVREKMQTDSVCVGYLGWGEGDGGCYYSEKGASMCIQTRGV